MKTSVNVFGGAAKCYQCRDFIDIQQEIIRECVKYMDQDRIKVKIKWRLIQDLQRRQICQLDITCTVMC